MIGHAVEVQPGVVPGIPIGSVDRALPLRQPHVGVSLAPVDAVRRVAAHPHRVAGAGDPAIGGLDAEAVNARLVQADVLEHVESGRAGRDVSERLPVQADSVSRYIASRPIEVDVLATDGQIEGLARFDHGRSEPLDPCGGRAHHFERRPIVCRVRAIAGVIHIHGQHRQVVLVGVDVPSAPSAGAITVDQREGVTLGKRSAFEQERRPRADRAVPLRPPRDLDLREPDVRHGGPDRDEAIARTVVLQVAAIPLRVSPDHNLASLLQGKFADGIGQLHGDPRIGCEGTARAELEPAQGSGPLVLEAELFDHLIDPRIGIEGAPVRSLSEGHHRLASRPLGIEQLPEGGLQNPRSAVGHGAAGERVVVYPAPQHRRALG